MADRVEQLLSDGLAAWGVHLPCEAQRTLCDYLQLLTQKNEEVNLTAVSGAKALVRRHLLDSLAPLHLGLLREGGTLIDVGTGAGLPGLPLAVAAGDLSVTLLDSLGKRIDFLSHTLSQLAISNAQPLLGRAEELGHHPAHREVYRTATARAVAPLRTLCEYCLPFVRVGGTLIAYKGADVAQEVEDARNAIEQLGGKLDRVETYRVPGEQLDRSLVVLSKIAPCDARFPRRHSRIVKNPL